MIVPIIIPSGGKGPKIETFGDFIAALIAIGIVVLVAVYFIGGFIGLLEGYHKSYRSSCVEPYNNNLKKIVFTHGLGCYVGEWLSK